MQKKIFGLVLPLIVAAGTSFGQTPCFTADFTRGCAPLTVSLANCSGSNDVLYDFNNNGQFTSNPTFTYDTPGLKSIRQIINTPGGGADLLRTDYIEVLAPEEPEFTLTNCLGQNIKITITDTYYNAFLVELLNAEYIMLPGEEMIVALTEPGEQVITVTGYFNTRDDGCSSASQSIDPDFEVLPAVISELNMASNNTFDFVLNLPSAVSYQLEESVNGGAFVPVAEVSAQNDFRIEGRDAAANTYCYRLVWQDPCSDDALISNVICAISFEATVQETSSLLSWQAYARPAEFVSYRLSRDIELFVTNGVNVNSFTDSDLSCGQYCYELQVFLTNGHQVRAPAQCVTIETTADLPTVLSPIATAFEDAYALLWDLPPNLPEDIQMRIERTDAQGELVLTERLASVSYIDNGAQAGERYCYRVQLFDNCDNESDWSDVLCPVVFDAEASGKDGIDNRLVWLEYIGGNPPLTYILEIYNENGILLEEVGPFGPDTRSFLDRLDPGNNETRRYRVRVVFPTQPGRISRSHFFELPASVLPPEVEIPDAFTPNGDGLNDTFRAYVNAYAQYSMKIFNRWGIQVFASELPEQGWDGIYNGEPAQAGPYSCIVEVVGESGEELVQKSVFLLIR